MRTTIFSAINAAILGISVIGIVCATVVCFFMWSGPAISYFLRVSNKIRLTISIIFALICGFLFVFTSFNLTKDFYVGFHRWTSFWLPLYEIMFEEGISPFGNRPLDLIFTILLCPICFLISLSYWIFGILLAVIEFFPVTAGWMIVNCIRHNDSDPNFSFMNLVHVSGLVGGFGSAVFLFWSLFYFAILPLFKLIFNPILTGLGIAIYGRRIREDINKEFVKMEKEKKELENEIWELESRLSALKKEHPDLINTVVNELSALISSSKYQSTYGGVLKERAKRKALEQISKTAHVKMGTIEDVINICEKLTKANDALAELSESQWEFEKAKVKREVRQKWLSNGKVEEVVNNEMEVEALTALLNKIKIETDIKKQEYYQENLSKEMQKEEESAERKRRPAMEVIAENTARTIAMLKAQGSSLAELYKAQKEELNQYDPEREPELYHKIKSLWDAAAMEIMEKKGNPAYVSPPPRQQRNRDTGPVRPRKKTPEEVEQILDRYKS